MSDSVQQEDGIKQEFRDPIVFQKISYFSILTFSHGSVYYFKEKRWRCDWVCTTVQFPTEKVWWQLFTSKWWIQEKIISTKKAQHDN